MNNWTIETARDDKSNEGLYICDGGDIANLYVMSKPFDDGGEMHPFPNAEENAKIIAQAPELLHIVEHIQRFYLQNLCDHTMQDRMKTAIRKARGLPENAPLD